MRLSPTEFCRWKILQRLTLPQESFRLRQTQAGRASYIKGPARPRLPPSQIKAQSNGKISLRNYPLLGYNCSRGSRSICQKEFSNITALLPRRLKVSRQLNLTREAQLGFREAGRLFFILGETFDSFRLKYVPVSARKGLLSARTIFQKTKNEARQLACLYLVRHCTPPKSTNLADKNIKLENKVLLAPVDYKAWALLQAW